MIICLFIFFISFISYNILELEACQACGLMLAVPGATLAACPRYPEAWGLKLLAIDLDPGAKLGPPITHDLKLSCDGLQLAR